MLATVLMVISPMEVVGQAMTMLDHMVDQLLMVGHNVSKQGG